MEVLTLGALTVYGRHFCGVEPNSAFVEALEEAFLVCGRPWTAKEALDVWYRTISVKQGGTVGLGHLDIDRRMLYLSRKHPLVAWCREVSLLLAAQSSVGRLLEVRRRSLKQWNCQRRLEEDGWLYLYNIFSCPKEYGCPNASHLSIQDVLRYSRALPERELEVVLLQEGEPLLIIGHTEGTLLVYDYKVIDQHRKQIALPELSRVCISLLLGEASADDILNCLEGRFDAC